MNSRFVILQFLSLCLFSILCGCGDKVDEMEVAQDGDDYFVFGRFAGFCGGESCIEIFKIENNQLFEDTVDEYPSSNKLPYPGQYKLLSNEKYKLVQDLPDAFPEKLMEEINLVLGMPDAYDQGGIYIELKRGDKVMFWVLDGDKHNLPEYVHSWADLVIEKVGLLQ